MLTKQETPKRKLHLPMGTLRELTPFELRLAAGGDHHHHHHHAIAPIVIAPVVVAPTVIAPVLPPADQSGGD